MKSYWIKRIVRLLILLLGVSVLCFVLTALSSTDPAVYIIRRGNLSPTPEMIAQVRTELGLDQPLPVRYFNWIGGSFTVTSENLFFQQTKWRKICEIFPANTAISCPFTG